MLPRPGEVAPPGEVKLDGLVSVSRPLGSLFASPAPPAAPAAASSYAWTISERKLGLLFGDLGIVLGGTFVTLLLDGPVVPRIAPDNATVLLWMLVLGALWVTVARALDCYDLVLAAQLGKSLQHISAAAALTFTCYLLIPYWSPPYFFSGRSLAALNLVLLVVPLAAWRTIYAVLLTRPAFYVRALILGRDTVAATLAEVLRDGAKQHGYAVVAAIDDTTDPLSEVTRDGLVDTVRTLGVREIIVCPSAQLSQNVQSALVELAEQGVSIVTAMSLYETLTGRVLLPFIDSVWLATLPARPRLYAAVSRLLDIAVAGLILVILALPLLLAAVAVVLDSPGPPLYWQERVGRYGRRFRMIKFRTMVQQAEMDGHPVWARPADPRVTRIGAFLRRSRLDELPQLVNVVRGHMSLIGPRPERPAFVDLLGGALPMYRARHVVRPGITGWAQVRYRYGASIDDAAMKLQYDLYYVRHRSLLLDAIILLKTVAVVLRLNGV